MKLKKGTKITLLVIAAIAILVAVIFLILQGTDKKTIEGAKVVNEIKEYGYTLKSSQTSQYKDLFQELEKVLASEEVDEEAYAKLVSQMFVMDFYTLDNKIAKTDIGGLDFVIDEEKEDFQEKAMDTIYKYLESNIYGDRKQELPVVTKVNVGTIETTSFTYGKETDKKAYKIPVTIEYKKSLGYDTQGTIILVHVGKKLVVAEWD